jgi:hypothetical protein
VRVSTLRPRSTTLVKRVSSMTTVSRPAHVQRALPGRGHGEHVRLLPVALEEGADDADRLAAVVVRRVDARVAHGHARRGLLDARARGQEDAHPRRPFCTLCRKRSSRKPTGVRSSTTTLAARFGSNE